jgi:type II pantothenate kinase
LDDLFAGMKAQENAVAAALFPALAREMDAVWNEKTTLNSKPSSDAENDADEKRVDVLKAVLECCLAGNLFDAGAAAAVQGVADAAAAADDETCGSNLDAARLAETFAEARRRVARDKNFVDDNADSDTGWRFDSFDAVSARIKNKKKPWRRVVIFCDNAGADVMGMCLLARTLVQLSGDGQCKVALAANEWAALNDVTARETRLFLESVVRCAGGDDDGDSTLGDDEAFFGDGTLLRQMERGLVTCVSSGQISTLLDLNRCGSELNDWVEEELHDVPAGDDWLLVFDGMGRSLESNWDVASFVKPGVNTLNLAMVKSQINAERLGAEVYDCVVKLGEGGV